jgi:peptide-methionine (S)-S-oxide reductase
VSGYMGGQTRNPTYEQICTGRTGHAEVIQLKFNPELVSFRELLEVFFVVHDPTTLNRQGADVGTQYRSAIFFHSPEQKAIAEEVIHALDNEKIWDNRIVTEVTAADTFYPAEDYHQEYFANNPTQGYCAFVIQPKVAKFRKYFIEKLKA